MPPASGCILSVVDATKHVFVIELVDLDVIATALEEHHEVSATSDIRGDVVHAQKFAQVVVELPL